MSDQQQPEPPDRSEGHPPPSSQYPGIPSETTDGGANSNDRILAALGYIFWFVALIVLILDETKQKPLLRDHSIQALGFHLVSLVYSFFAAIVFICGTVVTLGIGAIVLWVVFLPPFVLSLLFAWFAYDKTDALFEIPLLTDFLRDQGLLDTLPPR